MRTLFLRTFLTSFLSLSFYSIASESTTSSAKETTWDWRQALTAKQKVGVELALVESDLYMQDLRWSIEYFENLRTSLGSLTDTKLDPRSIKSKINECEANILLIKKNITTLSAITNQFKYICSQDDYKNLTARVHEYRLNNLKTRNDAFFKKSCKQTVPSRESYYKPLFPGAPMPGQTKRNNYEHQAVLESDKFIRTSSNNTFGILSRICILLVDHMGEALLHIDESELLFSLIQCSVSLHEHYKEGSLHNTPLEDDLSAYAILGIHIFGNDWQSHSLTREDVFRAIKRDPSVNPMLLMKRFQSLENRLKTDNPLWAQLRSQLDGELYEAIVHRRVIFPISLQLPRRGLGQTGSIPVSFKRGEVIDYRAFYDPQLRFPSDQRVREVLAAASSLPFDESLLESEAPAIKEAIEEEVSEADMSLEKTVILETKEIEVESAKVKPLAEEESLSLSLEKEELHRRTLRLSQPSHSGEKKKKGKSRAGSGSKDSKRKFWASLDKIFDHSQIRKISWKDFSVFWTNKLGHELRKSTGGSHHSILMEGAYVGPTYRPHSQPTFPPAAVLHLRKVLLKDGRVREYLEKNSSS